MPLSFQNVGSLFNAMRVLEQGIYNNSVRFNIAAQNYVNERSVAAVPGGLPYQRRVPVFRRLVQKGGRESLDYVGTRLDPAPFQQKHEPYHPAADPETGVVLYPNVQGGLELLDMSEATLAQRAEGEAMRMATTMAYSVLDLMK